MTAQFWLPLVLTAQPPKAKNKTLQTQNEPKRSTLSLQPLLPVPLSPPTDYTLISFNSLLILSWFLCLCLKVYHFILGGTYSSERPRGTGSPYFVVWVSRQFSNFLFESFWFMLWQSNSSWNHGVCWTVNSCCLGNRWRGKISSVIILSSKFRLM